MLGKIIPCCKSGRALGNKIPRMLEDCMQSLFPEIFRFFTGKPKPAAKFRTPQGGKKLVHITHLLFLTQAHRTIQSLLGRGLI